MVRTPWANTFTSGRVAFGVGGQVELACAGEHSDVENLIADERYQRECLLQGASPRNSGTWGSDRW